MVAKYTILINPFQTYKYINFVFPSFLVSFLYQISYLSVILHYVTLLWYYLNLFQSEQFLWRDIKDSCTITLPSPDAKLQSNRLTFLTRALAAAIEPLAGVINYILTYLI